MGLVDIHIHYAPNLIDENELLRRMDGNGIDHAMVLGLPDHPCLHEIDLKGSDNESIAELSGKHPDRISFAPYINPLAPYMAQEIIRRYHQHGALFVKTMPAHGWALDDERAYPVYSLLSELGMGMIFHSGMLGRYRQSPGCSDTTTPRVSSKLGHPILLDEPVRLFPEMKFVIAHSAYPWTLDALEMSFLHDNVFMEFSCPLGLEGFNLLMRLEPGRIKWQKLLWGSDTAGQFDTILSKWELWKDCELLHKHKNEFFSTNAVRLLKLNG